MDWDLSSDRPIYIQLMELFRRAVATGDCQPGQKVDAVRDLASAASVNPNTMQRALLQLEQEGLVYTKRTAGRFITEDRDKIEQLRKRLAEQAVIRFLDEMEHLGFYQADIERMLAEANRQRT